MPFVLLSSQRAGSNLLMSALNSHPNIVCEDEMFRTPIWKDKIENNDKVNFIKELCNNEKNKSIRIYNEIPYLDKKKVIDQITCYGIMVKYNQLERLDEGVCDYILKNNKIIHLSRYDVIRRGIGHVLVYLALKKKINLKLHFQKEEIPETISFDEATFKKVKKYIIREERLIKKYSGILEDKNVFNLLYEDLTNNSNINSINYDTSILLCNFLNVPFFELKPTIIKNENANPKNIISNYLDLINYLKKEIPEDTEAKRILTERY